MSRAQNLVSRSRIPVAALLAVACAAEAPPTADTAAVDTAPGPAPVQARLVDPLAEMRRVEHGRGRVERTYRLVVVNAGLDTLVVRAEAGAGEVMVDSIAAGDSVRAEIVSRSDSVGLIAGRGGAAEVQRMLRFPADSARRLEIDLP